MFVIKFKWNTYKRGRNYVDNFLIQWFNLVKVALHKRIYHLFFFSLFLPLAVFLLYARSLPLCWCLLLLLVILTHILTSTADQNEEENEKNGNQEHWTASLTYCYSYVRRSVYLILLCMSVNPFQPSPPPPIHIRMVTCTLRLYYAYMLNCVYTYVFKGKQLINRLSSQVRPSTFHVHYSTDYMYDT